MNYITLPKIELHCHLDGSVRLETILDLVVKENILLPTYEIETVRDMLVAPKECNSLDEYLEMCPTSNIQTKAVDNYKDHPIYKFLKERIKVTVNTDNRTVSNTTLSRECEVLFNELNISYEDYKQIYYNSVDAAFTDIETKEKLKNYIEQDN